ncbi:MAG: MBL fold metallo-hydrolase [Acidobacteria bacterium]|nr:MBL fold metallo-hydrolase [Acidobacteriota bacterium]
MGDVRVDVLVIGDLAKNTYWGEKAGVRQEYATATLVRAADVILVVDPGWPAEVMRSALYYRAGLEPKAVTHVFLTHFDPAHYGGAGLFEKAKWWIYEEEIRWAEAELAARDPGRTILKRLRPAPEKLAPGVDLFPTFGHTPGHASLLAYTAMETLVVAGDAVLTRDHFEHGDLGEGPWDLVKAKESFGDVMEIADLVVPGHDNLFVSRASGGRI